MTSPRIDGYLVAGGTSHDIDFVRLRLLGMLAEHANLRVQVASTYEDVAAIEAAAFLISYTCNVAPSPAAEGSAFDAMLGSQFLAHPPLGRFKVHVEDACHPLVSGIEDFDTIDELDLAHLSGSRSGFGSAGGRTWVDGRQHAGEHNRTNNGLVAALRAAHAELLRLNASPLTRPAKLALGASASHSARPPGQPPGVPSARSPGADPQR